MFALTMTKVTQKLIDLAQGWIMIQATRVAIRQISAQESGST